MAYSPALAGAVSGAMMSVIGWLLMGAPFSGRSNPVTEKEKPWP